MGSTYVVSDLHSCYSKFIKSIPSDTSHLIINGDCFNKGREQEEMFRWVMKNRKNPKYTFILGNTEIRLNNELVRHFYPSKTSLYMDWLGTHSGYANKNITNVVIDLIENKKMFTVDDVFDLLQNWYRWYYRFEDWIIAHASWELNKTPEAQSKINLVYDTQRNLQKWKKLNYELKIPRRYAETRFIFGHTPVQSIKGPNADPPVILHDRFFYIDNGIFKTANKMFYLKIK